MFCFFLWKNSLFLLNTGMFMCDYTSATSPNIIHRASAYLDVALLPKIFITSVPQFPNCVKSISSKINVEIKCIIDNSTETYNVTWSPENSLWRKTSKLHRNFLSHCAHTEGFTCTHKTVF